MKTLKSKRVVRLVCILLASLMLLSVVAIAFADNDETSNAPDSTEVVDTTLDETSINEETENTDDNILATSESDTLLIASNPDTAEANDVNDNTADTENTETPSDATVGPTEAQSSSSAVDIGFVIVGVIIIMIGIGLIYAFNFISRHPGRKK